MLLRRILAAIIVALPAVAQVPLPDLRIEPVAGGSIVYVKNVSSQPLNAWLIELVDYPGSSYSMSQDDLSEPVPPGVEKRIPVSNMTVGAVPDYVKIQAAIYADGTSSGIPEKVNQLIEQRRAVLVTTRELIRRIEATPEATLAASLKQWADSIPQPSRTNRGSQAVIDNTVRSRIAYTVNRIEKHSVDDALTFLRTSERALAASKPPL